MVALGGDSPDDRHIPPHLDWCCRTVVRPFEPPYYLSVAKCSDVPKYYCVIALPTIIIIEP